MEIKGGSQHKLIVCIYEALGTALLMTAINWCNGRVQAISIMIFTCYVIFGPICGGHFNPAVTIGVLIYKGT